MDRKDIGSWLLGPKAALEQQGIDFGYPGKRFGMPETGPGSIARVGRRIAALSIDWFASNVIVAAFLTQYEYGSPEFGFATLAVFVVQVGVLTGLIGSSFGQKFVGIGIRGVSGQRLGFLQSLLRTVLLATVVPAVIWDRDGRGLHDRAVRSVAVKLK